MKLGFFIIIFNIILSVTHAQTKTYCYTLKDGTVYKLNVFESNDTESKVVYNLYSKDGYLLKTLKGSYIIIDEGVYSTARKIVADFNGSQLKWLIIYDNNGQAQSLQDEVKRTIWDKCY